MTLEIVSGLIVLVIGYFANQILSGPREYISTMRRRATEKEYKEFLELYADKQNLMILFLDKIARSISVFALWIFGVFLLCSPAFRVDFSLRYFWLSTLSIFMFLLVFYALSKPININYAINNPEKYKDRVIKKLGKLPYE